PAGQLVGRGERLAEGRVEAARQVLGYAHDGQVVADRRGDGSEEGVLHSVEHGLRTLPRWGAARQDELAYSGRGERGLTHVRRCWRSVRGGAWRHPGQGAREGGADPPRGAGGGGAGGRAARA